MISKSAQRELRRRLEEQRAYLRQRVDGTDGDVRRGSSANPDRFDLASDFVRHDRKMALLTIDQQVLDQIDEALHRMDDGAYGICLHCGEPIDLERLQALPYAPLCMTCQNAGVSP